MEQNIEYLKTASYERGGGVISLIHRVQCQIIDDDDDEKEKGEDDDPP